MKLLLLTAFCITSSVLLAQEFQPDIHKLMQQKTLRKPDMDFIISTSKKLNSAFAISKGKQRVYSLSQDNMPCIVPDTNEIAAIPNTGAKYNFPSAGRMPGISNKKSLIAPSQPDK